MNQEKMEQQVGDAIARELDKHPEINKTLLSSIHDSENDALVVARIAQNMYPLNMGFFTLLYDHLVIEELASGPFVDSEGKTREIIIDSETDVPAVVEGNNLILSQAFWEDKDLQATELKNILGRWFLGLHVKVDGKLSAKHQKAIAVRLSLEVTAFSDLMNKSFFSYSEEKLRALALTIVDLGYNFISPLCPNYCTSEEYNKMYQFACDGIFESMNEPSDKPLIRAFNTALPNAMFLDDRSANIRRIFTGIHAQAADNPALQETVPLDYMTQCMTLVRF